MRKWIGSQLITYSSDQLCLGIIASGIGFVLAQRTPFRLRDIRRRLLTSFSGCLDTRWRVA